MEKDYLKGKITDDWYHALSLEYDKPYFSTLMKAVEDEYASQVVYPPKEEIFTAFNLTPLSSVKVVIMGQDPYPGAGQAHGLAFSVKPGIEVPRSLKNIYKELQDDIGCSIPDTGYLAKWASQGVLMLNNVLTVRGGAGQADSHKKLGWQHFTDAVVDVLNAQDRPMVFLLWGNPAQKKCQKLNNPAHLILKTSHPSPLSARKGFFGCKHFSKTNDFLQEHGLEPIDWQI